MAKKQAKAVAVKQINDGEVKILEAFRKFRSAVETIKELEDSDANKKLQEAYHTRTAARDRINVILSDYADDDDDDDYGGV